MRKARILIAHPDKRIQGRFQEVVDATRVSESRCLSGGREVLEIAQAWLPDLLILGASMPDLDGFEVCARLRNLPPFSEVPLLLALSDGGTEERYRAYRAGADEILDLPFDPTELAFRLMVHFRRRRIIPSEVRGPGILLDPRILTAYQEGGKSELTPSEYAILSLLVQRTGTLVGIDTILVEALGALPRMGNPQLVHTHIRNLRRKLESDPTASQHLQTGRNGYYWA